MSPVFQPKAVHGDVDEPSRRKDYGSLDDCLTVPGYDGVPIAFFGPIPMSRQTMNVSETLAMGLAHHQAGRLKDAEEVYSRVLDTDSENPEALHLLGTLALQTERPDRALKLIEKAILKNPGEPSYHNNLGEAHRAFRDNAAAIVCYRRALEIAPDFSDSLSNLGDVLTEEGELEEAEACYRHAIDTDAGSCEALAGLGNLLGKAGILDDAERCYRQALAIASEHPEYLNNLGLVLKDLHRPEEACDYFHQALEAAPDHAAIHNNLGNTLEALGKSIDAHACYSRAIALDPNFPEASYNLGKLLMTEGRLDDSMACYLRVLEIAPDHARAHQGIGYIHFLRGQWRDAWEGYEWRWRDSDRRHRSFTQARWQGEPIKDKTVLVWSEQGVGDEIFFASMVPDVMAAGAHVVLESDPRLVPLYQRSFQGVECVVRADPPIARIVSDSIDFQIPIGSLGRWFRSSPGDFPDRRSYLSADGEKTRAFRAQYRKGRDELLIGISWLSKNVEFGGDKSMTLREWLPAIRIPGARFIDLQYGDTADERRDFADGTGETLFHDEEVDSLADLDVFAAQVAALDLVISISNTTVHLAGALGVPVWVLLSTVLVPPGRWMVEREDSPWYPCLRLFRQSQRGEWGNVIERVVRELTQMVDIRR